MACECIAEFILNLQYFRYKDIPIKRNLISFNPSFSLFYQPGDISPLADLDPDIAFLHGQCSEMEKYRVLGVIDQVMLVLDTQTDSTYVMKVCRSFTLCKHPFIMPNCMFLF